MVVVPPIPSSGCRIISIICIIFAMGMLPPIMFIMPPPLILPCGPPIIMPCPIIPGWPADAGGCMPAGDSF